MSPRLAQDLFTDKYLFLFHSDTQKPFGILLNSTYGVDIESLEKRSIEGTEKIKNPNLEIGIVRVRIPFKLKNKIRWKLWEMNISHSTLFPGKEGFLKGLRHYTKFGLISE